MSLVTTERRAVGYGSMSRAMSRLTESRMTQNLAGVSSLGNSRWSRNVTALTPSPNSLLAMLRRAGFGIVPTPPRQSRRSGLVVSQKRGNRADTGLPSSALVAPPILGIDPTASVSAPKRALAP